MDASWLDRNIQLHNEGELQNALLRMTTLTWNSWPVLFPTNLGENEPTLTKLTYRFSSSTERSFIARAVKF